MTKIEGVKKLPWCKDKYPEYVKCWAAREGRINNQLNCEGCDLLKNKIEPKEHGGRRTVT